jgi:hypothetical protein
LCCCFLKHYFSFFITKYKKKFYLFFNFLESKRERKKKSKIIIIFRFCWGINCAAFYRIYLFNLQNATEKKFYGLEFFAEKYEAHEGVYKSAFLLYLFTSLFSVESFETFTFTVCFFALFFVGTKPWCRSHFFVFVVVVVLSLFRFII